MSNNVFVFGSKENENDVQPDHVINLSDQIYAVQWSPFDWSEDLLSIAFTKKISIASCKFFVEQKTIEFEVLREFHCDTRVHCMSWSPKTSLTIVPKVVCLCIGGSDFQLRIFESDLVDNHNCKVISGHKDYINDVSYEPDGQLIASVSDDQTCRVWSVEELACEAIFNLNSAGITVCWHNDDSGKLLVAEKSGIIRLYNVFTQLAILSFDNIEGLSYVHWNPNDSKFVAAFTGEKLMIWNLTNPSRLVESNQIHSERGGLVKISSNGEIIASLSLIDGILKIAHVNSGNLILQTNLKLPAGLSWHHRFQIVCVADDFKLCFWKLPSK